MFSILPRDTGFFDLFDQGADVMCRTTEAYHQLMHDYAGRETYIARIRQLEHEGDSVVQRALRKLDKTFIAPFDREDIHALVKRLDDVVDELDAAAKRMTLYQVPQPTDWLKRQAEILLDASRCVQQAIVRLRDMKRIEGLHDLLLQINKLEAAGDENNHAAVAELYNTTQDAILVIKLKEIYDRSERAIDRCEDIANTIQTIVLKFA
ncbi:MAG: DUF47 family protein [Phycisphaerae bacterium]